MTLKSSVCQLNVISMYYVVSHRKWCNSRKEKRKIVWVMWVNLLSDGRFSFTNVEWLSRTRASLLDSIQYIKIQVDDVRINMMVVDGQ